MNINGQSDQRIMTGRSWIDIKEKKLSCRDVLMARLSRPFCILSQILARQMSVSSSSGGLLPRPFIDESISCLCIHRRH